MTNPFIILQRVLQLSLIVLHKELLLKTELRLPDLANSKIDRTLAFKQALRMHLNTLVYTHPNKHRLSIACLYGVVSENDEPLLWRGYRTAGKSV